FDPEGDPVTFTAAGLPPGLSVVQRDGQSALIQGTISPGAAAASPYTVTFSASDGLLSSTSPPLQWFVSPAYVLTPVTGDGQTAAVNTPYATPFQVKVMDLAGNAVAGATVTFFVQSEGAGGTFASGGDGGSRGSAFARVQADANGLATPPPFTANDVPG